MNNRRPYNPNPPPEILGQVTTDGNVDVVLQEYTDRRTGKVVTQLMELTFATGEFRGKPGFTNIWRGSYQSFLKMLDMFNAVADARDEHGVLPIRMSLNDPHFKEIKDEAHT